DERSTKIKPVRLRRGPVEKRLFLVSGISGGDALEGIPDHRIVDRIPVRREIALEHAALRTKVVYAMPVERSPVLGQLRRGSGRREFVETHTEIGHAQPAELDENVRAF